MRNKHFGPRPRIAGRRRLLDPAKKVELCEHVAKGAPVEEAAETVGVSLRTVQRERRLDEDFDHELQLSLRATPDPLKMMQAASRTHWRAAAWLLERTNPEHYARRPAQSASPGQFEAGLEFIMEAALAGIPPELQSELYDRMTAAAKEAFACLFPNYGRWGNAKRPKLPATPLVAGQSRQRLSDPRYRRVIAEDEAGRIEQFLPPEPPAQQPIAARPQPVGWVDRAAATRQAPEGRRTVARGAGPWTNRTNQSKPQRGDVAPAFRSSRLREVRSIKPRPNAAHDDNPLLSPKMCLATKQTPNDKPLNKTPVSRDAAAERVPRPQTRRERAIT